MSRRSILLLIAILPLTTAQLCQWNTPIASDPPSLTDAPPEIVALLDLGETRAASLDCGDQYCSMRFRIDVPSEGILTVVIDSEVAPDQGMRATLLDPVSLVLRSARASASESMELRAAVTPGPYSVLVQAIGGTAPFSVRAELDDAGAAPRR